MLRVKADCHTPNCLVIHLGFNNLRPLNVPGMIFFLLFNKSIVHSYTVRYLPQLKISWVHLGEFTSFT